MSKYLVLEGFEHYHGLIKNGEYHIILSFEEYDEPNRVYQLSFYPCEIQSVLEKNLGIKPIQDKKFIYSLKYGDGLLDSVFEAAQEIIDNASEEEIKERII